MRTCGGTRSKYRVELRAIVGRPGRVVRRGDEDELRARRDRGEQSLEVDALVGERDANGNAAELQRVEHVARERGPGRDHLVARVDDGLAEVPDHRVGAGTDRHLLDAHAVALCESVAEAPGAAVRVAVELERGARDRLQRIRERPIRALVGRELDDTLETELALDLLDGLAGLVRNEPRERGTDQRRVIAPRGVAHVAGRGSGAVTYSPTISFSISLLDLEARILESVSMPAPERDGENARENPCRDEAEPDVGGNPESAPTLAALVVHRALHRLERQVADGRVPPVVDTHGRTVADGAYLRRGGR